MPQEHPKMSQPPPKTPQETPNHPRHDSHHDSHDSHEDHKPHLHPNHPDFHLDLSNLAYAAPSALPISIPTPHLHLHMHIPPFTRSKSNTHTHSTTESEKHGPETKVQERNAPKSSDTMLEKPESKPQPSQPLNRRWSWMHKPTFLTHTHTHPHTDAHEHEHEQTHPHPDVHPETHPHPNTDTQEHAQTHAHTHTYRHLPKFTPHTDHEKIPNQTVQECAIDDEMDDEDEKEERRAQGLRGIGEVSIEPLLLLSQTNGSLEALEDAPSITSSRVPPPQPQTQPQIQDSQPAPVEEAVDEEPDFTPLCRESEIDTWALPQLRRIATEKERRLERQRTGAEDLDLNSDMRRMRSRKEEGRQRRRMSFHW